MARPTKMNPRIRQAICEALRCGNTRQAAAEAAGVDRDTLRRWIRRGEQDNEGTFKAFYGALTRAEAEAEQEAVSVVKGAFMAGEWRAAAWWLERRRPESYREQKEQRGSAAAEETTVRIIYEAEVAKDMKPWTRNNNGGAHDDRRTH